MPFDFGQFLDRFYLSRVGVRVLMGQVCRRVFGKRLGFRV